MGAVELSPVPAPVVVETWPNTIENGATEGGASVDTYEFFEINVLVQFSQFERVALPHSQFVDKKGVELIPMSRTLSMRSLCREAKSSFALDSMGLNAVYGMATVGMCGGDDDVVSRGVPGFSLSAS